MKNLDCNQIKIFINLEIIEVYFYKKNLKFTKISAIWWSHLAQPRLLNLTFIINNIISYDFRGVWYTHSNTYFQFLNNVIHIFIHFFIHMYFYTYFQTTKHIFSNIFLPNSSKKMGKCPFQKKKKKNLAFCTISQTN